MAPEEGRNVRNKLVTITMAVIFVIEINDIGNLRTKTIARIELSIPIY